VRDSSRIGRRRRGWCLPDGAQAEEDAGLVLSAKESATPALARDVPLDAIAAASGYSLPVPSPPEPMCKPSLRSKCQQSRRIEPLLSPLVPLPSFKLYLKTLRE
jgi:hypothetical protein